MKRLENLSNQTKAEKEEIRANNRERKQRHRAKLCDSSSESEVWNGIKIIPWPDPVDQLFWDRKRKKTERKHEQRLAQKRAKSE